MEQQEPGDKKCEKCGGVMDRPNSARKRICYACYGKIFEKRIESPERKKLRALKLLIKRTAMNPQCVFQAGQGQFCVNKNMPWSDYDVSSEKKRCAHSRGRRACPLFKPWHSDIYREVLKQEKQILDDIKIEQQLIEEAKNEIKTTNNK